MDTGLHSLRHRDVLDVATATVIGRVDGVVLAFGPSQVVALIVGKGPKGSPILPWGRIVGIGPDAVTIDSADALRAPEDALEERAVAGTTDPLGKPVITDGGDAAGRLTDLAFDAESGALRSVSIDDEDQDPSVLISVGDFAAVVRTPG